MDHLHQTSGLLVCTQHATKPRPGMQQEHSTPCAIAQAVNEVVEDLVCGRHGVVAILCFCRGCTAPVAIPYQGHLHSTLHSIHTFWCQPSVRLHEGGYNSGRCRMLQPLPRTSKRHVRLAAPVLSYKAHRAEYHLHIGADKEWPSGEGDWARLPGVGAIYSLRSRSWC